MHSRHMLGRAHGPFSSGRRARILFVIANTLALSVFSGSAHASSYDWGTGASDVWENSALWSPIGNPGSSDTATVSNGQVTVDQETDVDQLTLSTSSTVLNIEGNGNYGDVGLTVANSISNAGTINLEAQDAGYDSILTVGGTLTNNGTINLSGAGPGGIRALVGNVVNNYAIDDAGQTTYIAGNVTNNNLYERQSGGTTYVTTGNTFTQQAYKLIIDSGGTFNINGGTFIYAGGSVSGAVNLYDGYSGGGSDIIAPDLKTPVANGQNATFNFYSSGNLDTDLPTNTNLNVIGNGNVGDVNLNVSEAFTNNGTITLEAQDAGYFTTLQIGDGSGTVTNNGTINLSGAGPGGQRQLTGNVVNNYIISDAGQTTYLVGNVTNNNLYERQAGGTTDVTVGYTFTQNSGQLFIDTGGTFNVNGSTFIYSGGTIDNGPVNLYQANYPASSGISAPHLQTPTANGQNAVFNLYATGYLDTDFPSNTTLNVIANGNVGDVSLNVPDGFTNYGTINLEAQDAGYFNTLNVAGTLTNNGTITLSGDSPGGGREIQGNVVNNYQLFDAGQTTYLVGNVTNNNLYERLSGGTTNVTVGYTFTQNAGQLYMDSGGVFNVNGATFIYAGGSVVGTVNMYQGSDPVTADAVYPHLQTSVANGQNADFNLYSTGYLDTSFSSNTQLNVIANGSVGDINLIVNDGATNNGTIELFAQDAGYQSGLSVYRASDDSYSGTYTIGHGGVLVSTDPNLVGGARVVTGNIINYGNIGIQSPLDVFGSVDDRLGGTVAINEGESLTLHGADFTLDGGTLILGPSASLLFTDGGAYQYIHGTLSVADHFILPSLPQLALGDALIASGVGAQLTVSSGGVTVAGGNLIAKDGGSVIGVNGAAIVSSGAGNVIGVNGAAITSTGAGSVIGVNGAALSANDGGRLIANDGGSLTSQHGSDSGGFVTASVLRPSSSLSLPPISQANIVADGGSITLNAGYASADDDGIIENGGLLTGNGTFTAAAFDVDATSTVVATGGTLHLLGAMNPYVGGTLTTGHWQVEANSTLDTPDIGDITINQASITLDGVGSIWTNINNLINNQGSFTITHGRNFLASAAFANSGTLIVGPSSTFEAAAPLTNTGTIDIAGGTVQLDQGLIGGTIIAQLRSGFANGSWNGSGITSSLASAHPGTAVGYTNNGTEYTLMYTWLGDTNLDGVVNAADLSAISPTGTTWQTGDFNYDGVVNADDYALFMLGSAYGSTTNISATLPEPAGWMIAIGLAMVSSMRRRRIIWR
jgi:hypothetical protein